MDQAELIRTLVTLVCGGGGVAWLSAFLSRRGQREENTNQRVANDASARLAEAAEDRAQLTQEREENTRLRGLLRAEQDRREERAAAYEVQVRECREQCARDRETLQETFEAAIRVLTADMAALREVTVRQVRHVAEGGDPAGVPTPPPSVAEEFGV